MNDKQSTVYHVPMVLKRTTAQRAYIRETDEHGRVAGGIRETIICDPEMTCNEAERGLVDAAERAGIDRGNGNVVIEESGTGTVRDRIVRDREKRGLVSYAGKPARTQRAKGKGKYAS